MRLPSTSGDDAMPWYGQSLTRPVASLSWTICHINWPSDSRNAIKIPLSPVTFGSRRPSLLVPMKTMPPDTTTLPKVCEPSWATHLMFFFVFTSQVVGSPFMLETMLRSGVPPHMGQSPVPGSDADVAGGREQIPTQRIATIRTNRFLTLICSRTPLCFQRHRKSVV